MSEDNEVVKQPEAEADGASTESKEVSSEAKASNGEVKTAEKAEENSPEPASATSEPEPVATATVAAETSPAEPATASSETPVVKAADTAAAKAAETPVAKAAETSVVKPAQTPAAKTSETPETKAPVVSVVVTPAATPAAASAAATPAVAPAKVPAATSAAPLAVPPTLPTPQVPQQGGITQRRSRWYTSTAALRYISSLSRDQEVKVRDSDLATSIFLLIAAIATVLSLILSPLAHLRLQLVMVCDALVGAMLLFYVVNRFGIINTLTPRQAILAWQLMVGSAFMGVFLTINFAVIVALIMAQTSVEIPR